MSKKKKHLTITVFYIFCMSTVLYFTMTFMSKVGIIRDEYGLTGKDNLLTFRDEIFILYLPIAVIIINVISLLYKSMKKQFLYLVIIISTLAVILSAVLTVKKSREINNYHPEHVKLEEFTFDSIKNFTEEKIC